MITRSSCLPTGQPRLTFPTPSALAHVLLASTGLLVIHAAPAVPDHYAFGPVPAEVMPGEAFPVSISALDGGGQVIDDLVATLHLRTFQQLPELPVISEVDPISQVIEVTNPGEAEVSLEGWELVVGRDNSPFMAHARVRLGPDAVLSPMAAFTWSASGTPPGTFPTLIHGESFDEPGYPFNAARLFDPSGKVRDEVLFRAYSHPKGLELWRGPGLTPTSSPDRGYSRSGDANRFQAGDWVTTSEKSPGLPNPQLNLPWSNAGTWLPAAPSALVLGNGVWSGDVALPPAGEAVMLVADDGAGLQAFSSPIRVPPLPALTLVVPAGWQTASEADAGVLGKATLRLSEPLTTDLTVTLSWSAAGEFSSPPSVVFAAGTDALEFEVSNLDDPWADGDARVELTASAPGCTPSSGVFQNADDEAGELHLSLPAVLTEGSGMSSEPGRVWMEEPARHGVLVQLTAGPPLEVPALVIIPAGRLSATFPLHAGNDPYVNPDDAATYEVAVTARTANWPSATAGQSLREDESRWMHLEAPATVREGESALAVLTLDAPRTQPFDLTLDTSKDALRARLGLPIEFRVPADTTEYSIPLQPPQNTIAEGDARIEIAVYENGAAVGSPAQLMLLDDDGELGGLRWNGAFPKAVMAGQPFRLAAGLITPTHADYHGDMAGQLELLTPPSVARLAPGTESIQFVDGIWEGDVMVLGEALGVELRLSVGGNSLVTPPFDLLPGMSHYLAFADVQWWPGGECFLVVETPEGGPVRLIALEPLTGAREPSLELPHPASLLALSDDGTTAWLTAPDNSLMSVDLINWELTGTFPLAADQANARADALLVLPGDSGRVAVAVAPGGDETPYQLRVYAAGVPLPGTVPLETTSRSLVLVRGRTPTELFCQAGNSLFRCSATPGGVALDAAIAFSYRWSLDLWQDWLISAEGETLDAETLQTGEPFPIADGWGSRGCLPSHRPWYASIDYSGWIRFFDLASREKVASHWTPYQGKPEQMLRWGDSGLAVVFKREGVLQVFESPALRTTPADLEVSIEAPTAVDGGTEASFTAEITVVNHGPAMAPGVELWWSETGFSTLGNLVPGEVRSVSLPRSPDWLGMTTTRVVVSCPLEDPVPENNLAEAVTAFPQVAMAGVRQLFLGMSHLIGSPDQQSLYAALSRDVGGTTNGIAIVNPALGEVVQVLPEPEPVRRLAISDDGDWLYAQWGDGNLTRWNLTSLARDLTIQLPGEVISDFAPLPGLPFSFVIAAGDTIQVFDGDQPRTTGFTGSDTPRRLGFANGLLWAVEAGQLRSFKITPSGLLSERPAPFSPFDGNLEFSTDGLRLFFMRQLFDPRPFAFQNATTLSGPPACAPLEDSLYAASTDALRRVSMSSLELLAEQPLPRAFNSSLQDLVRWGPAGLAGRRGHQLLLLDSPLVPAGVTADLKLTVTPPAAAQPHVPFEWTVTVANRSAEAALRTLLVAQWDRLPSEFEILGPSFDQRGNDFYFNLGTVNGGQEVTIRFRGQSADSGTIYHLSASLLSAAHDPTPDDHTAYRYVQVINPTADLGVTDVSVPRSVEVDEEFLVSGVLTNAGPDTLPLVRLNLSGALRSSMEFLGCEGCGPDPEDPWTIGNLAAGDSIAFTARAKATQPGLHTVTFRGSALREDSNPVNDFIGVPFSALPPADEEDHPKRLLPTDSTYFWDPVSRLIVVMNPGQISGLATLDSRSLRMVNRVVLSGVTSEVALCGDGEHAWLWTHEGFSRVNYLTGLRELTFAKDFPGGVWALASPPGDPNVLLVAASDGLIRVYDGGVPRPKTYPVKFLPTLFFTSDGRLFTASQRQLRELRLDAQGVTEVRNLDKVAPYARTYTEAGGRLFAASGRVIDIESGESLGEFQTTYADVDTGWAYRGLASTSPLSIQTLDATNLEPVWQASFPKTVNLLVLGTEGFLVYSGGLNGAPLCHTMPLDVLGPRQTDLQITLTTTGNADGVGYETPMGIEVVNRSPWTSPSARLEVTLAPGLQLAAGQPGEGTLTAMVELGTLVEQTNLTLRIVPTSVGTHEIQAAVSSALPNVTPGQAVAETTLAVPERPWVFVDDSDLRDGGRDEDQELVAWLSRPMPGEIAVPFVITPATASTSDFRTLAGTFRFTLGRQTARAAVIRPDSAPEYDETATLFLSPVDAVKSVRLQATLTIWNDDWPTVQINRARPLEGNAGTKTANIRFALDTPAPWPVAARFRTHAETATAGIDFVPREGWLVLDPGQTHLNLGIPIISDSVYERDETVQVSLVEVQGGFPGTSSSLLTIVNDDLPPQPSLKWMVGEEGRIAIEISTVLWATYQLQQRTNLVSDTWKPVGDPISGNGEPTLLPAVTPELPEAWFRVGAK